MFSVVAQLLCYVVLFGLSVLGLQLLLLVLHMRRARPTTFTPGISVLKPLCGADDELETNLEEFASLTYPGKWELLLGIRSSLDPAYPIARQVMRRHPERVRVFLQRGEPGLNPKVNQLITLMAQARHPLVVVSDSNVRVPANYLSELASHFEDPTVGCVTHPIGGRCDQAMGAAMDNIHMAADVGSGMVIAQKCLRKHLVVGKSMALWRADLEALGGWDSVKDILAEDHILGNRMVGELKKRVVISRQPVFNVSIRRSLADFQRRYLRWAVIHRTAIPFQTYLGEAVLNPLPLAVIAVWLHPGHFEAQVLGATLAAKLFVDLSSLLLLGGRLSWRSAPAVWIKDLLLFSCWTYGLFAKTVMWRGNRLKVLKGSRLVPPEPTDALEAAPVLGGKT